MQALGLIEVIGYPAAIEGADAALKAANINLNGLSKVGSGIMTVTLYGDVGAVKAAVEAGSLAASKVGTLRASHIIPRVDNALIGTVLKDTERAVRKNDTSEDAGNSSPAVLAKSTEDVKLGFVNASVEVNQAAKSGDISPTSSAEPSSGINTNPSSSTKKNTDLIETEKNTDNKVSETNSSQNKTLPISGERTREAQGRPRSSETKRSAVRLGTDKKSSTEEWKKKGIAELRTMVQSLGISIDPERLKSAKKDELIQLIEAQSTNKKGDK